MLPLLAVGEKLFVSNKIYKNKNIDNIKQISIKIENAIDDGNNYLNDANEYREDIELEIKMALEDLNVMKKKGIDCLLNNYKHLRNLYLEHYEEELRNVIIKEFNLLNISINEVLNLNNHIGNIIETLGINLEKYYTKEKGFITNSKEIILGGVVSATILGGTNFISSISIKPIVLKAIIIISNQDIKKSLKDFEKAKEFKQKAFAERKEWQRKLIYIHEFTEYINIYSELIEELINLNELLLNKFKDNDNSIISKILIASTYLNRSLTKYPSIDEYNICDNLDEIINWIKHHLTKEKKQIEKIYEEVIKIV